MQISHTVVSDFYVIRRIRASWNERDGGNLSKSDQCDTVAACVAAVRGRGCEVYTFGFPEHARGIEGTRPLLQARSNPKSLCPSVRSRIKSVCGAISECVTQEAWLS